MARKQENKTVVSVSIGLQTQAQQDTWDKLANKAAAIRLLLDFLASFPNANAGLSYLEQQANERRK